MTDRRQNAREVRPPVGTELNAKSWLTEAPLRMLMNNLHPDVAENPDELVVYGGIGRAARDWNSFDKIVESLKKLNGDETLLVQSGKPVGVFRTHENAPRVLIANSNLVPHWANWDHFNDLDKKGLMMYGQMTAGSWIYIGTQGIVQGTYETFAEAGRQHYGGDLTGKWILTAGLGGMGGAQGGNGGVERPGRERIRRAHRVLAKADGLAAELHAGARILLGGDGGGEGGQLVGDGGGQGDGSGAGFAVPKGCARGPRGSMPRCGGGRPPRFPHPAAPRF